jgi:hypothetical protein
MRNSWQNHLSNFFAITISTRHANTKWNRMKSRAVDVSYLGFTSIETFRYPQDHRMQFVASLRTLHATHRIHQIQK